MRVRVLIVEFHVPLCAEHFVFITGPLFALFLNFPCLEVNLMQTKFLNMSAELCSQLFRGCFPIPVQSSFENWQLKNRKLAKQQQIGVRST